ncbi:hypothetical protein ASE13_02410 [Sphingomonas sp. Root241]|nr:hypothetical protein ASE13_02410 [Sphingomonas sp. Root241]
MVEDIMSQSHRPSDNMNTVAASAKAEARAAESAAVRRRWITLGKVLAVIAAVISGLTLWNEPIRALPDAALA